MEDDSSQAAFDAQKNDVINFGYFHTERGELKRLINEVGYGALNRNDPDPMEDDINMANHSIINLKDPFNDQDAATKKYVNTTASDYLRKDGTSSMNGSIIHFSYNGLASGFNDLDINIKLKSKTDPQTTIYVVVYGVKGNVNNVSVSLWDRLYYYDNDSIEYEVPINMNGKDIIDVNKITTKYLDVNDK